jgi:hypothetical protein
MTNRKATACPYLRALLLLLLICSITSCATWHVDYAFEVSGKVSTGGKPLPGVEVNLIIDKPVYKAITPVSTARAMTDEKGEFVFSYLTDSPSVNYSITFRKQGFEEVSLRGKSENREPFTIEMKRNDIDKS